MKTLASITPTKITEMEGSRSMQLDLKEVYEVLRENLDFEVAITAANGQMIREVSAFFLLDYLAFAYKFHPELPAILASEKSVYNLNGGNS